MLDRTYVDTIENIVGIVETCAERIFRDRVPAAQQLLKGKGNVFQRLHDLADLYTRHLGLDPRGRLGTAWTELEAAWAARHAFTHSDGIVDSKYLAAVQDSPLREGQRVRVAEEQARSMISAAQQLCRALGDTPA